jgi:hypothetical protein
MLKPLESLPLLGQYVVKPLFGGVNFLLDAAQLLLFLSF